MEKKLSKDSTSSAGNPEDLATKKKEVTEAVKKDMEHRAQLARQEIEALCKKHRVEIVSMPNLAPMPGGLFGMVGQTIIRPME